MRPAAFDANAINTFQEERISGQVGSAHAKIGQIFNGDCIALDAGGLCLQEWIDCAGGKFPFALTDWIDSQMIVGKIRLFDLSSNECRKHLLALGIPTKDHKWVRLAVGSTGKWIVTDDVDFFDPSKKKADKKTKDKVKCRGGPCSKALKKVYGIDVETV